MKIAYKIIRISRSHRTQRDAFTVLELLVTVALIAVLMAMLLPAIGGAREAVRRVQCTSHLREVGVALHNHHDAIGSLPVGWSFDPSGESAYGWAVSLLPYLEQPGMFESIDPRKTIQDPSHRWARETTLQGMLCPSDIASPTFDLYQDHGAGDDDDEPDGAGNPHALDPLSIASDIALVRLPTANYVGVFGTIEPDDSIPAPIGDGAFLENDPVQFREFTRGLSGTLVVGERTMAQVPSTWFGVSLAGEDAAARVVGSALEGINNPLADECDFSSRHPGGANFLWGDGHVSFVTQSVDLKLYHEWSQLRF